MSGGRPLTCHEVHRLLVELARWSEAGITARKGYLLAAGTDLGSIQKVKFFGRMVEIESERQP
jgi:hypothetical protein